ncbi:MAG: DUF6804 family protein [Chitinophagales bacterium]
MLNLISKLNLASTILLLVALLRMPYGYYSFMRIGISAICIYLICKEIKNKSWAFFFYCACFILHNPVFKVHFRRGEWFYIDIVCAVIFLILAIANTKPISDNSHYRS